MSPLPLPLGRLLRSARGAGSCASRAVGAAPCAPALAGASSRPRWPPAPAPPTLPAGRRQPFPGPSARASGRRRRRRPKAARRSLHPSPLQDLEERRRSPPAASVSPSGAPSWLPSFLSLSSSPTRSLAAAAVSLHIVRSLLPLPSPPPRLAFGLCISSLFITYFDPASLCPRFLRKFYCPRSRVFD